MCRHVWKSRSRRQSEEGTASRPPLGSHRSKRRLSLTDPSWDRGRTGAKPFYGDERPFPVFERAAERLASLGLKRVVADTVKSGYLEVRKRVREDAIAAAGRYFVPRHLPGDPGPLTVSLVYGSGGKLAGYGQLLQLQPNGKLY